jgi:nitroreductase
MAFLDLVEKRYSVRKYKQAIVEDEKLKSALNAARLAPTAANMQPFRIIVVHTEGNEEGLRKVYPGEWFTQAPIVVCFCAIPASAWLRSDKKNYADIDVTIAADHFAMAATELGLGTCWIAAFNPSEARKFFKLGKGEEPVVLFTVGYAADKAGKKIRKALGDIVTYFD